MCSLDERSATLHMEVLPQSYRFSPVSQLWVLLWNELDPAVKACIPLPEIFVSRGE
jgi:hypothetical protein